jgi:hypothetical protein
MMDVMLSLDTTASMTWSGDQDMEALQQAVAGFITELNPTSDNPNSPKIGIATFAGIKCQWSWTGSVWDPGTCTDDKKVLVDLTTNKDTLIKVANGTGAGSCPSGVAPWGCPIDNVPHNKPVANSSTGTKLPNAISVLNNGGYYAWDTSHGGRNNSFGEGNAKKIAVVMTDGSNEAFTSPSAGPNETVARYNSDMLSFGDQLKRGRDGNAGTVDDVEIYTVGFFCTPYSDDTSRQPDKWCKSRLAATTPPPCPGSTTWPPASVTPSDIDNRLRNWSSSTDGTCDHYFPISKRDSLPALFKTIAARLMKVRLTQ